MKKVFIQQFKDFYKWYKSLEHQKQLLILDVLNKKKPNLLNNFTTDELDRLSTALSRVPKFIAETVDNDEGITLFKKCGFDDLMAKSLIEFGQEDSAFYRDVKLVKSLNSKQLKETVDFIIEKMFLYEDYSEIPFKNFVTITGLSDSDNSRSVLSVLQSIIESVANRKNSPEILKKSMEDEYGFSLQQSDVVISSIKKHLSELQQAYLLQQINEITLKLSNLSCASETGSKE